MKYFKNHITIASTKKLPNLKEIEKLGFKVYKYISSDSNNEIHLTFVDFISFCKSNDIDTIFVKSFTDDISNYYIFDDIKEEFYNGIESDNRIIEEFCDEWNEELERCFPEEEMYGCGEIKFIAIYNGLKIISCIRYNPIIYFLYEENILDPEISYDEVDGKIILKEFVLSRFRK